MAIRDDGLILGSVSGGCVETSVVASALDALETGIAKKLVFDSVSDETAWSVGLSCGGSIEVWLDPTPIERSPQTWEQICSAIDEHRPISIATDLTVGAQRITDGRAEPGEFVYTLRPQPKLIIVGAVHIAIALIGFAKRLDFRTVVIDPRLSFARSERFPDQPDSLIVEWPQHAFQSVGLERDSFVVLLTHDAKIDEPALEVLLRSDVAYVGALGSRVTQTKRRLAMLDKGFSDDEIDRIFGPVGLDIGAATPDEIALSIMAEIIKVRRARS